MEEKKTQQPQGIREEFTDKIKSFLRTIERWLRPNKQQPKYLQVLIFIVKLPVLLLLLALSPVFLVVLLVVFMLAI